MLVNRKGEWGPFQLLITVIVMGMSLAIGAYLVMVVSGWKCETDVANQANMFAEKISSVGYGDIGSVETVNIKIPDCVQAIYLRGAMQSAGLNCKYMCPQHPDSCWLMIIETRTRGAGETVCIDISGSTNVVVESQISEPLTGDPRKDWKATAYPFYGGRGYTIRISKSGINEIKIGRVGGEE